MTKLEDLSLKELADMRADLHARIEKLVLEHDKKETRALQLRILLCCLGMHHLKEAIKELEGKALNEVVTPTGRSVTEV